MTKKRYLRMNIRLASSLSIGSGANDNTDRDIIVGADHVPYIPGTAVAGVTRHALANATLFDETQHKELSEQQHVRFDRQLFGYVEINRRATGDTAAGQNESRIVTHDVILKAPEGMKNVISNRDMVALDTYKTAIEGAKFDMETLEPGAEGTVVIEQNVTDGHDVTLYGVDPLKEIARLWKNGHIRFGSKTTRGYGAIEVLNIDLAEFDFDAPQDVKDWLDLGTSEEKADRWKNVSTLDGWKELQDVRPNETVIKLGLQQAGGISIRRYTTAISDDGMAPDYVQMTYADGDPVIPGTSWAGAFRHDMIELLEPKREDVNKAPQLIRQYFGVVSGDNKIKSRIYFSESRIRGGTDKRLTRVAINRFTGGAKDKALFTESTHYGGTTELIITLRENAVVDAEQAVRFRNALAAAIVDLHEGILAVGGETSIGRGLFRITSMNDEAIATNIEAEDLYKKVQVALVQKEAHV